MGDAGPKRPWSRTRGLGTAGAIASPVSGCATVIPATPDVTDGIPNCDAGCSPAEFANRFIKAARAWDDKRIPPPISVTT